MTDADDRSGAGAQGPAEHADDAALEQQLAPIVLEGEQVPAVADEAPQATAQPQPSAFEPDATAPEGEREPATGPDRAAAAGGVPPGPTAGAAPVLPAPPPPTDDATSGAVDGPDDAGAPVASAAPEVAEQPTAVGSGEQQTAADAADQPTAEPAEQQMAEPAEQPTVEPAEQPTMDDAAEQPTPVEPAGSAEPPAAQDAAQQAPAADAAEQPPAVESPAAGAPDPDRAAPPPASGSGPRAAAAVASAPPGPGAGATPVLPPAPDLSEVPADAGKIVPGRVREVRGDDVIVDLDDGRVGVINRRNLGIDGDLAAALSPGDAIEGAVLARSDPQHRVVLSRTWALKKRSWEAVASAAADNQPLTGTVISVGQKGVIVDVGVRGFVPASHLELGPVRDLHSYAGQQLTLRVLDLDPERERLVLSRRSLLLKEQRRSAHDALSSIHAGEVRRGTVASVSEYGAFVDVGGVTGLVHLSELSWHRVRHPSEVLAVGDEVDVKVLDVKVKKRRVSLSIRQLSDDPLGELTPGEIRTGPVTRLVDFGAFVDLAGVEGLVHLSELAEYRVSAPEEIVAPGEEVRVKVLSVDRKRRRIELSIRQAAEYGG